MTAVATARSDVCPASAKTADRPPSYVPDMVGMAPDLFTPRSVDVTLDTVAKLAGRSFGSAGAGVVLTAGKGIAEVAATTADARRAEAMQVEHHEGPGFDAIAGRQLVTSAELRFDSRWRFWAPQAADLGFRSVLSLVLADSDPFGAVTLYSRHPSYFDGEVLAAGLAFAQFASIAITVAVEREQLVRARDSRGIVGQAQGILMERYDLTADQAFAVLRRYSSYLNKKLRQIAEWVISDRSLPELDLIGFPTPLDARHRKRIPSDR